MRTPKNNGDGPEGTTLQYEIRQNWDTKWGQVLTPVPILLKFILFLSVGWYLQDRPLYYIDRIVLVYLLFDLYTSLIAGLCLAGIGTLYLH